MQDKYAIQICGCTAHTVSINIQRTLASMSGERNVYEGVRSTTTTTNIVR